jgi:hypothetical protein
MGGWVKLHRQLLDSELWLSEKFTRGQAWVDLFGLANHEDSFFYLRDHKISVKRGQVGWSQLRLSKRWGWSRSKVRKFLNDLEKEQQIEQQQSHSTSIITILNYEKYQEKRQQVEQQKDNSTYTNKDEKNEKNISSGKSAIDFFAPEINGWDKENIQKTIDGFISIRKSKKISLGVVQSEFEYWSQFPDNIINKSLSIYVTGRYWEKTKGEKYLRGIIRGKNKEAEKEKSNPMFKRAF